ncbi:acetyltransferase [Cyclobacterium xiamenense]|uniref:acetyltransferase n=1 Tax=Cyclobacterium xiamenense TaxID=1297121 RepID=UPI0035D0C542
MIIAGAGGHALEVYDALLVDHPESSLFFFDNIQPELRLLRNRPVLKSAAEIQARFSSRFDFVLGVGNPKIRHALHAFLSGIGGQYRGIVGQNTVLSEHSRYEDCDVLHFTYIGASVSIGTATLVNVGVQVHHEAVVGRFCEISPGAIVLGRASIGNFSLVGSGAVILPNVTIGDHVVIGTGSIVTRDIPDFSKVIGVPGRVVGKINPMGNGH